MTLKNLPNLWMLSFVASISAVESLAEPSKEENPCPERSITTILPRDVWLTQILNRLNPGELHRIRLVDKTLSKLAIEARLEKGLDLAEFVVGQSLSNSEIREILESIPITSRDRLKVLRLDFQEVEDDTLAWIMQNFPNLKALSIVRTQITGKAFSQPDLANLAVLKVNLTEKNSDFILEYVKKNPSVQRLDAQGSEEARLKVLDAFTPDDKNPTAPYNNSLRYFNFPRSAQVSPKSVSLVRHQPNLKHIAIDKNPENEKVLEALAAKMPKEAHRPGPYESIMIFGGSLAHLPVMVSRPGLKKLAVSYTGATPESQAALHQSIPQSTTLEELELRYPSFEALSQLARGFKDSVSQIGLKRLTLRVSPEVLYKVPELINRLPAQTKVTIEFSIDASISVLEKVSRLERLRLDKTGKVSLEDATSLLKVIQANPSIRHIDLEPIMTEPDAVRVFLDGLIHQTPSPQLETLSLPSLANSEGFPSGYVKSIIQLIEAQPNLRALYFSSPFSVEQEKEIAKAIRKHRNLEEVRFFDKRVQGELHQYDPRIGWKNGYFRAYDLDQKQSWAEYSP